MNAHLLIMHQDFYVPFYIQLIWFQSTAYAQNPRLTDESAVFIGSAPMVGVSLSSNEECVPTSGSAVMKASVSMTLPPEDILVIFLSSFAKVDTKTVRDVTWMSDQFVHLAKWMAALEQVTVRHLVKCPHQLTTWSGAI